MAQTGSIIMVLLGLIALSIHTAEGGCEESSDIEGINTPIVNNGPQIAQSPTNNNVGHETWLKWLDYKVITGKMDNSRVLIATIISVSWFLCALCLLHDCIEARKKYSQKFVHDVFDEEFDTDIENAIGR